MPLQTERNIKIFTDHADPVVLNQFQELTAQPAFQGAKVRVMPDVHADAGQVTGYSMDLGDKVIPGFVGCDIGCGILCIDLGEVDVDCLALDALIRERIPTGNQVHDTRRTEFPLNILLCESELKDKDHILRSLGTLGGGNHFIEVDADSEGRKYLIIHSGSRGLGMQVGRFYQSLAVQSLSGEKQRAAARRVVIEEYTRLGKKKELSGALKKLDEKDFGAGLPDRLCYLTGNLENDFIHDMVYCELFAARNRMLMANEILSGMGWEVQDSFQSIHNQVDPNSHVIRSGAISAERGEKVIIPLNMRDGCILGRGKGNEDWNSSAPHGAGRCMTRRRARQTLHLHDYEKNVQGVYSTCISRDTITGAPMAYKPSEEIIRRVGPTVRIEKIIRPVYNFRAGA